MYRVTRAHGERHQNRRRYRPSFYVWLITNPRQRADMPFVRRLMDDACRGFPHQPSFEELGRHLLTTSYSPEDVGRGLRLYLEHEGAGLQ